MNVLWFILIAVVNCSASLLAYDYSDYYDKDDYDYDYLEYNDESNEEPDKIGHELPLNNSPLHSTCDNVTIYNLPLMMKILVNTTVDVYLTISNSKITSLKRSAFLEGKNIKRLYFRNSTIDSIEDETFSNLMNLEILFLHDTKLKVLSKRAFRGLNKLQSLDLSNNSITELDANIFNETTSLIDIYLHNNLLKEIDPKTFLKLNALEMLQLYNNFITKFDIKLFTEKLKSINLSNNTIAKIADGTFSIVPSMYDVSHNKLTSLTKKMFGSDSQNKKLLFLLLSNNNITFIEEGLLESFTNLVRVNLDHNSMEELTNKVFSVWVDIDFTFNKIKTISNIIIRSNCIKFDVSHNAIAEFNGLHAPNLTQLLLNNNKLIGKLAEGKFSELNKLHALRLDNNKISDISCGAFIGLENLFSLNISHNAIENLNIEIFYPMQKLQVLDVRGNHLKTMDLPTLKTNIQAVRTVLLAHNPWNCDELVKMLRYLTTEHLEYQLEVGDRMRVIECKDEDVTDTINQVNVTGNDSEIIHNEIIKSLIEEEIIDMPPKGEQDKYPSLPVELQICVIVLIMVVCVGVAIKLYFVYKRYLRSRVVSLDAYEIIEQHAND